MKILAIIVAVVFGVTLLAGIGILTVNTVHYMSAQHFPLGEAIANGWQDTIGLLPFVNGHAETEPNILEFGPVNLNIDVIGLGVKPIAVKPVNVKRVGH